MFLRLGKNTPGFLQIFVPRYCSGAAKGAWRLSSISASSGLQSLDETRRRRLGFSSVFSRQCFFCRKARIIFGADLNLLLFFLWWIDGGYIIIYSSWKKRVEVVMDWHGMKGELWFLKRRDWPTILSKAWTSTSSFPFIYNMIRCGCSIPNGGSLFITPSVLPMYDQYP